MKIFHNFLNPDFFSIISVDTDKTNEINTVFMFLVFDLELTKENFWNIHDGLLNTGFEFDAGGAMFFSKKD